MMKPSCVNRINQIDYVKNRLNTIRLGQSVSDSVLEWYGIPGIGKTTLAQIGMGNLCQEMNIPFACIDFDPDKNKNADKYYSDTILILQDIFKGIGIHKPTCFKEALKKYRQADDHELKVEVIKKFLKYVNELIKDAPVMLLFDSTEKADSNTTAWLEKEIISPLCMTGRCIIIWTGRFPQCWRQFEVRRRVISQKLEPFPLDVTIDQISKISDKNKKLPSEKERLKIGGIVYQYTFGHPQGNKQLLKAIIKDKKSHEKDLINVVNSFIDGYVMEANPDELKAACRVLAIVRHFDVDIVRKLLSHFVDFYRKSKAFLKVVGQLTATSLVEWDSIRKWYALDETVRHILALHLQLNQPEQYSAINKLAAEIYKEWIEKVRENRSVYILERLYHLANVASCKEESQSQITDKLKNELKKYLQDYCQGEAEFAYSDTERLANELEQDREIEKIIGIQGVADLKESVGNHLLMLKHSKEGRGNNARSNN